MHNTEELTHHHSCINNREQRISKAWKRSVWCCFCPIANDDWNQILKLQRLPKYRQKTDNINPLAQCKSLRGQFYTLPFLIQQICYYNIVAAFRGMHVSPAKHSYVWLSRKCDYRTDRHTHTQTDAGQSDPYVPLCFAGDTKMVYCEIIYFHGAQFSWIHENGYIVGAQFRGSEGLNF